MLKEILSQIDLNNIIITVLGVIGSYVLLFVKSKWNELKSNEIEKINNDTLKSLAKQAVDFVELKFKDFASVDKLDHAFKLIQEELKNKGIVVSDLAVNLAIESAVKALKDAGIEVHSNITVGTFQETPEIETLDVEDEEMAEPKRIIIKNNNNI